jgi:predicted ATPase
MRAYFGVSEQDSDEHARRKIAGTVLLLDKELADDVPLLLEFLGGPDPEHPVPRMDPEARQRRLVGIVKGLIHGRSRRESAVLLMEDLHWFDEASLVFVEAAVEALPGTRTLLLLNFRPEYQAAWTQHYDELPLLPLGPSAIANLLRDLLGADPSVAPLLDRIRERTGGNPFFIEEVVQSLIEARTLEGARGSYRLVRPITDVVIPSTVQAVLDARIDRLPERERTVLKTAAVIGKEFAEPILKSVVDLPEAELTTALGALTSAEFLHQEALYPEAVYAFKHPLTQEAAYRSHLVERRARVHRAVARATADVYADKLDERAALLAYHWEAAGDALESARWHRRAAEWVRATDLSAALDHWRRVRTLLKRVPESAETIELGLAARTRILGLSWTLGISPEEGAGLCAEGEALARRSGDLRSLAIFLTLHHDMRMATGGALTPAAGGLEQVVGPRKAPQATPPPVARDATVERERTRPRQRVASRPELFAVGQPEHGLDQVERPVRVVRVGHREGVQQCRFVEAGLAEHIHVVPHELQPRGRDLVGKDPPLRRRRRRRCRQRYDLAVHRRRVRCAYPPRR